MNISALKAYGGPNALNFKNASIGAVKSKTTESALKTQSASQQNSIVTQEERDFFIKLFPENKEQLLRHSLFNRAGKLQAENLQKGMLVDARV